MSPTPPPPVGSYLDGADRQETARRLWDAWRVDGRSSAVIYGISGVGKTQQLIYPLIERCRLEKQLALQVDVPMNPTDAPRELMGQLAQELQAREDLPAAIAALATETDFFGAIQRLLNHGALVVVDEFQRLLGPAGIPIEPFAKNLGKLSARGGAPGCLWLASNRVVD